MEQAQQRVKARDAIIRYFLEQVQKAARHLHGLAREAGVVRQGIQPVTDEGRRLVNLLEVVWGLEDFVRIVPGTGSSEGVAMPPTSQVVISSRILPRLQGTHMLQKRKPRLLLVPDLVLPPKFKVPEFEKFDRNSCPSAHIAMLSIRWYNQLNRSHIKTWKDLAKSLLEQYKHINDMRPDRTKDGLRARQDLEAMGIKPELQTQPRGNRTWLPPACYTLNTTEKHRFYETLSTIKVPDGYCSNFKNLVPDDVSNMNGLKSNDCHVLMQQLLPFAIKGVLHVKVRKTIIECYVAEEALEFCSDYLKNMKSIGNPHERVDERIRIGKPLSRGTVEVVDDKLLDEAHLYVLRNTADVEPYIDWLKTKVDTHFANGEDICESVRWLAKGPSFVVKKYSGFAINEYRFHTTSRDESRTTQCSGVSLVAYAMQIASAKDSNPVYGAVTYYGRIQEIWDLDYRIFTVPVFIQAKQVFYVQDQQDANLSVVGFTPHKMYKYGANGETDDMLEYHVVLGTMESDQSSSHDEDSKQRGPTIKGKTIKGKVIVTYNKKGVPIGVEAMKLSSFEGMVARSMVPITYATWRDVEQAKKEDLWQYILMNFKLDPRSRKNTLQSIGKKWKNFKHYLYKKFIEKFNNDPNANLLNPPEMYPYLKKDEWKVFVSQRLSKKWEEISEKAKKMRGQHRYNHRLSRKGYAGLTLEIMQETGKEEDEIDRALLWKKARQMKKEKEMQKSETLGEVSCGTNDMLTQALGTQEQCGRVRGMGKFVRPHQYFVLPNTVKKYLDGEKKKFEKRFNQIEGAIEKLQKGMNHASEGASCQGWGKVDFEDNPPEELLDTSCYLAIDIASNIVAKGTIVKHNDLSVMMEMSVQGDALLPFPLDEEFIYKVKDAVGFIVKWPRHLVIRYSDLSVKVQCEDDMFGRHWVLAVIDMKATSCYYLDSLGPTNVHQQLKQVIDAAMKLCNAQSGSNKRVSLNWINVLCPRQSGGTECGYYVCKFMKEIVENGLQVLVNKNVGDGKEEYTDDDIDDICKEFMVGEMIEMAIKQGKIEGGESSKKPPMKKRDGEINNINTYNANKGVTISNSKITATLLSCTYGQNSREPRKERKKEHFDPIPMTQMVKAGFLAPHFDTSTSGYGNQCRYHNEKGHEVQDCSEFKALIQLMMDRNKLEFYKEVQDYPKVDVCVTGASSKIGYCRGLPLDSRQVSWKYECQVSTLKEDDNKVGHAVGKSYSQEAKSPQRPLEPFKGDVLEINESIKDEEAIEFLKILKHNEYNIVEQLHSMSINYRLSSWRPTRIVASITVNSDLKSLLAKLSRQVCSQEVELLSISRIFLPHV
ncbi:hypothetical protein F3Y22_tig00017996pilonHSYRG00070 [Hibiscus syriacus]|uniref:Ubiquitin-like protease family profile domain-containing protein n=1 Tax=Hibiscus syriacus TaxID=106335 RepID=A0A6A3C0Y0_HIBSY|nr:hypothetical protein F3Y22_tig00017996pilonHSYRG00070 [Hibiscus syriacus]